MATNKGPRFYNIDGREYPSVTTILDIISKPALYKWYEKNGAAKAYDILAMLKTAAPVVHEYVCQNLPQDFLKGGAEVLQEAADIGTRIHKLIEQVNMGGVPEFSATEDERVIAAYRAYETWRFKNPHKVIKSESLLHSKAWGYAGTCDAIAEFPDGIKLIDYKTSKGIFPEYALQVVAYKMASEEMTGEKIGDCVILRFGKDGTFGSKVVPESDHARHFAGFLDALGLWKWQHAGKLSKVA